MATLPEIRFDILNKLRGGRASDDDLIGYRQIDFNIKKKRLWLLNKELERGDRLNQQYVQVIPCLDLETVDKSECCDIKTECNVLRTKIPIPTVFNNMFSFVGPVDGSYNIQMITNLRSRWANNAQFTGYLPKAYYLNGYVYFTSERLLDKIKIQAVFEDPDELSKIDTCLECFDPDSAPFPIPTYMVDTLINLVLKDMEIMVKVGSDITNNSLSDTKNLNG